MEAQDGWMGKRNIDTIVKVYRAALKLWVNSPSAHRQLYNNDSTECLWAWRRDEREKKPGNKGEGKMCSLFSQIITMKCWEKESEKIHIRSFKQFRFYVCHEQTIISWGKTFSLNPSRAQAKVSGGEIAIHYILKIWIFYLSVCVQPSCS